MLRIAICDDRSEQLTIIYKAAIKYFSSTEEQPIIATFNNSLLFLEDLEQSDGYDIVLLDICMPGVLGTNVAKEIRAQQDNTEIIFLTSSDEYAIEAFSLKAAHYLLKPFTQQQFNEAMDRAMLRFNTNNIKKLVVKPEGGGVHIININDIFYIESSGHTLTVYTKSTSITEGRRSLGRFFEELEKLSPGQFILPYKGYLVNQNAILSIEPSKIILHNGACIPIPKRGFRNLQNAYFDYIFEKNSNLNGGF